MNLDTASLLPSGEKSHFVSPNVPAGNVRDLIALIKAKPDTFAYGSSGIGSTQHLAGEAFNLVAGTKSTHVQYKG